MSTSSVPATWGVLSLMKFESDFRRSSILAAHARKTSAALGLSSRASKRCSTVMNSCRCWRASTKAICKLTSNSWAIMNFSSSRSLRCYFNTKSLAFSGLTMNTHKKNKKYPTYSINRLTKTLQWMTVFKRHIRYLVHLGCSNIFRVDPADTLTI